MTVSTLPAVQRRKIAVVLGAPSSVMLAPYDDPSWEIWGLVWRRNELKRYDRLFEIHEDWQHLGSEYPAMVSTLDCPVVVGKDDLSAKHPIKFPFDKARELIGSDYLTSSAAYMIALAIIEGAQEIGLYGCDMAMDNDEYFHQRHNVEHWIGYAKGRGIVVTIPDVSPVGKANYVYGVNKQPDQTGPWTQSGFKEMAKKHADAMAECQTEIDRLTCMYRTHDGSRQAYERCALVAKQRANGQDIREIAHGLLVKRP